MQPPDDHVFVQTTGSKAAAAVRIGTGLALRKRAELLELLRPCFARVEPWLQTGKYAAALMSQIRRRNGWSIAEHAGDRTPDKTQRLLGRAVWDTFAAMGVVRRFAVAGLDEAARKTGRRRGLAVGAIDETGQVKQGGRTAGVKRQYLGCVGKVANGINIVHLAYVREQTGHALIGAREWIPAEQISDPARSQAMGLPPGLGFRTKGQLAIDVLAEVFAGGVRLDFVCGDEVYGSCTELREFLEDHDQAYVLRVPSSFRLALASGATLTCRQAAAARLNSRRGWEVRSAGKGSKGQRWYAWAWLGTASARHHLLIRRVCQIFCARGFLLSQYRMFIRSPLLALSDAAVPGLSCCLGKSDLPNRSRTDAACPGFRGVLCYPGRLLPDPLRIAWRPFPSVIKDSRR